MNEAYRHAASVEAAARSATRTVIRHETVTDSIFTAEYANEPPTTQLANTTWTRTVPVTVKVPDNRAISEAQKEARRIRREAEVEKRYLLSTALYSTDIDRNSKKRGMIYFDRVPDIQNVLLRIPLGDLTMEIPF
jgi:hypothetical protein